MYEFITLKLKCPACGEALMDPSTNVDHDPGVMLYIQMGKEKGTIWLSPVYGSYNFLSDIDIPENEVVIFFCPHCGTKIWEDKDCKACNAPMISLLIEMGGRVSFCSRRGCKNHFVEFEDFSLALKMIYQEYGFRGRYYPKSLDLRGKINETGEKQSDEKKEIIETGTFLNSYCPNCKKSLIENEMLKLKITGGGNQDTGYLMLSPYLNVYSAKSTVFLPENKTIHEIRCFHCDADLLVQGKNCGLCGSPVAKIAVGTRTRLIDFYICSKKGCKWHGLSEQDLYDIRLEDSLEW